MRMRMRADTSEGGMREGLDEVEDEQIRVKEG
jgi:hypothetical protein